MGQDLVAVDRADALLRGGLYPVIGTQQEVRQELARARQSGRLRKASRPAPTDRPGVYVAYLMVEPPRQPFWTTWRKVAAGVLGAAVVATIVAGFVLALPYIIAGAGVVAGLLLLFAPGAVRHCPGCRG